MGLNFEVVVSNPVLTKEINPMHLNGINSRRPLQTTNLRNIKNFRMLHVYNYMYTHKLSKVTRAIDRINHSSLHSIFRKRQPNIYMYTPSCRTSSHHKTVQHTNAKIPSILRFQDAQYGNCHKNTPFFNPKDRVCRSASELLLHALMSVYHCIV